MCKLFINKSPLKTFILGTLLVVSSIASVQAKEHDTKQEITIKSNKQAGDLKNKIISYLDNVSITQGSLSITADLVQVLRQTESNEDIYVAKGSPATFSQHLDDGSLIRLQADKITYEPGINTIKIIGNAVLSQEGSEVRGHKITYNTLTEQLQAESDPQTSVTTILKPQNKAEK